MKLPVLSYDKPWGLVRGIPLTYRVKQVRSLSTVASCDKAVCDSSAERRKPCIQGLEDMGCLSCPSILHFCLHGIWKMCCSLTVTLLFMETARTSFLEIKPWCFFSLGELYFPVMGQQRGQKALWSLDRSQSEVNSHCTIIKWTGGKKMCWKYLRGFYAY